MKILATLFCVLLGTPAIAGCNDDEAPVDLHRLLTYPFTGAVAWGVHDTDIEERILMRFGKANKRIPSISEESTGQSEYSEDAVLEYDDVTFHLRGKVGNPHKIIQGIIVKRQSAPIVLGIKLGQHISTLPIESPPEGVSVTKYHREYSIRFTSHGTIVYEGREFPATANCNLTIAFDDAGLIRALEWYYGTGH